MTRSGEGDRRARVKINVTAKHAAIAAANIWHVVRKLTESFWNSRSRSNDHAIPPMPPPAESTPIANPRRFVNHAKGAESATCQLWPERR